jgi:hypothetical protein
MNRDAGMVGEAFTVYVEEDGIAVGEYLRIKVRINITQTLTRRIAVNVGEDNHKKWCPFEYEFLPEFCYTCGVICHDDKSCSIKFKKGEKQ